MAPLAFASDRQAKLMLRVLGTAGFFARAFWLAVSSLDLRAQLLAAVTGDRPGRVARELRVAGDVPVLSRIQSGEEDDVGSSLRNERTELVLAAPGVVRAGVDRKSTRLNSSHRT